MSFNHHVFQIQIIFNLVEAEDRLHLIQTFKDVHVQSIEDQLQYLPVRKKSSHVHHVVQTLGEHVLETLQNKLSFLIN